jgi:hypothetical protein
MEARGRRSLGLAWLSKILVRREKRARFGEGERNVAKEWDLGS